MILILVLFMGLFAGLIPAIACGALAGQRGRREGLWALLGFLFGWIALLVLVFSEDLSGHWPEDGRAEGRRTMVMCPSCRSTTFGGDKCPACGEPYPWPVRAPRPPLEADLTWRDK